MQLEENKIYLFYNNVDLPSTVNGDLGISKMWVTSGSIYYALKATDLKPVFLVYNWSGELTMHYYASGSKKARTVSYSARGIGRCQT